MDRHIRFDGPAGILEAVLHLPETSGPYPGVVVCHPHPLSGGEMTSNVVMAVCAGAYQRGIATLRFNFRGVGASAGSHDRGAGEQDDVRAALAFMACQEDIDPERIGLAGYSFGARVAIAVADGAPQVQAIAAVSPPLRDAGALLATFTRPKLFLVGDEDRGIPADAVMAFAAGLPDPSEARVVPGADHFWNGFEYFLAQFTGEFFARCLVREPG